MSETHEYLENPLKYLDKVDKTKKSFKVPTNELFVRDLVKGKGILGNLNDEYKEQSDFFVTKKGFFGTREQQKKISLMSREIISNYYLENKNNLLKLFEQAIRKPDYWPKEAIHLMHSFFEPVLLSDNSLKKTKKILRKIIERSLIPGEKEKRSNLSRALFSKKVFSSLRREVAHLRKRKIDSGNILAIILGNIEETDSNDDIAEVYLSFIFSLLSSLPILLSWSLYLSGKNNVLILEPKSIVKESLRLWPPAWCLSRISKSKHKIYEHELNEGNVVVVCPYAMHRNKDYWDRPEEFLPERWKSSNPNKAFIPFGWGEHACIAGALSVEIVSDLLATLKGRRILIHSDSDLPNVGAIISPPKFKLTLD